MRRLDPRRPDILAWKPCKGLVLPPLVRQHAVDPIGVLGKLLLQVLAKRLRTMDRHSILMIDFERHRTGRVGVPNRLLAPSSQDWMAF